jgi:hypothetical protein
MHAPAAPANHQQHEPRANHLRARDLPREFEQGGLEVYNSPQTNLGATLAVVNHLEDTPTIRHLQANVRVAATQIEERCPRYNRSTTSSYSRSRSEHPRQRCRSNGPLEPVAEEGRGENEVMQSADSAANAAANPAANPAPNAAANPLANATANVVGNVADNAANAPGAQANTAANPRQNAGAQPPSVQANHTEGSQRRRIRDEVEIA